MGGSSSKTKAAAAAFEADRRAAKQQQEEMMRKKKEDEESQVQLLVKAFDEGREQALFEAMRAMEAQRNEHIFMGVGGCLLVSMLTSTYYATRSAAAKKQYQDSEEQGKAVTLQQQQDLQLERQRVQELAAVNDSQKMLLSNQQRLIEKSREQSVQLKARMRALKWEHMRLKRRYNPLRVEVNSLRAHNGVLHQRFIASTAGAIIMACVAGGFAIASHGSGDGHAAAAHPAVAHADVQSSVPATVHAVVPVVVAPPAAAPVVESTSES